jgi:hypothetical protein
VGPRAGLDDLEKRNFLRLELGPLGRPARNQSLYRLLYPGSENWSVSQENLTQTYRAFSEVTRFITAICLKADMIHANISHYFSYEPQHLNDY